ncbi:MAG TPA: ABC transporter permease [Bryobacteraceae bacterium]|jgi:predicted permease|nr:ABC transporter permease [Bryobacteraceae bacterium]
MFHSFLLRLLATLWPQKTERRLNEEFEQHLHALAAQQSERGLRPGEALLAARREFGPLELAKEQYRDQARFRIVEDIGRDLRFALRQCYKNPGFTAAAVLSLALGIGANAALFSFVNAVLLKELPVPRPERLVVLKNAGESLTLSYRQLNDLNREAMETDGLLGTHPLDVSVIFGDHPQWVSAELVTGEYFHTLQIKPERGRLLTQRDLDDAEDNPVCVISSRLWRRQFHGAEDAVGHTVLLNTRPYKIVGISQSGFTGPDLQRPADLQIPATRLIDYMPAFVGIPHFDWKSRLSLFSAIARLKPKATRAAAAAQLTRLNRAYLESAKLTNYATNVQLADGNAGLQSSSRLARPASILLAVSLLVLLIACANLATLLLARTSARSSEFALRLAIGGSRRRILAQVLVESALLAIFGTASGIAVAYAVKRILLSFLNRTTPQIHQLHIALDGTVLVFVTVTSAICVLLFGTAPALQAARTAALGSSAGNTRAGVAIRKAFVVVQIALSFIVVLSAGLLAGTLRNLKTVDLGFHADEIAAIDIRPAAGGYTGAQANRFYARVVDRVRALPGVKAAATAFGINLIGGFKMKLDPRVQSDAPYQVNIFGVNPGYFDTFGAHILAGRDFDGRDAPGKQQVYIISQHLAKTYFHGENPVGRYLRWNGREMPVIGVVSGIRDQGPRETSVDTVYQDAGQLLASSLTVFVRCDGPCAPLLSTLRTAIRNIDPNTPLLSVRTMQTEIEGSFSSQEVLGFLSTLFAVLAMLLVAAGIYGVLSYTLTRRTREMGIRMALGASRKDIASLFVSEAALTIGLGTLIGVPCALAAVTLLQSQLFGIEPHDPRMLAACVFCIVVTTILASIAPIKRALAIAPQQALRIE